MGCMCTDDSLGYLKLIYNETLLEKTVGTVQFCQSEDIAIIRLWLHIWGDVQGSFCSTLSSNSLASTEAYIINWLFVLAQAYY